MKKKKAGRPKGSKNNKKIKSNEIKLDCLVDNNLTPLELLFVSIGSIQQQVSLLSERIDHLFEMLRSGINKEKKDEECHQNLV